MIGGTEYLSQIMTGGAEWLSFLMTGGTGSVPRHSATAEGLLQGNGWADP